VSVSDAVEVRLDDDRHVATITLQRPDQRNALSIPMLHRLRDALGDLAVEPALRAVVLAGAGPDFCAGADLAELEQAAAGGPATAMDFETPFRDALAAIADHPVPVIARVQGRALGGGCQLVLASDLAVADEDASFGIPAVRLGAVIPFDSIERLVRAIGPRRAGELLFAARVLDADEAHGWGLVTLVAPAGSLDEVLMDVVATVASAAPMSVRASKRGIADAVAMLRAGDRAADFEMMAAQVRTSRDLAEGIAAVRQRRAPRFEGA
jgi:enoyl-CoA hydratase/carnithine racemase